MRPGEWNVTVGKQVKQALLFSTLEEAWTRMRKNDIVVKKRVVDGVGWCLELKILMVGEVVGEFRTERR
jgi:hypothetical protein